MKPLLNQTPIYSVVAKKIIRAYNQCYTIKSKALAGPNK